MELSFPGLPNHAENNLRECLRAAHHFWLSVPAEQLLPPTSQHSAAGQCVFSTSPMGFFPFPELWCVFQDSALLPRCLQAGHQESSLREAQRSQETCPPLSGPLSLDEGSRLQRSPFIGRLCFLPACLLIACAQPRGSRKPRQGVRR